MTAVVHWSTWREKCLLALCPSDTRAALQTFVHARFRHYAIRYCAAFQADAREAGSISADNAWHFFETYCQIHPSRRGKAYKNWLFARSSAETYASNSSGIESGICLLLRDAVREQLRKECSSRRILSLDAKIRSEQAGTAVSLRELLPADFDTRTEVARREIAAIAASLADDVFDKLSYRERLALAGRAFGLPVSNPELLKLAGCGKSVMAKAHRTGLESVALHVTAAYPGEARGTQASLTVAVFRLVYEKIITWAKTENSISAFLNTMQADNASHDLDMVRTR